MVLSAIAMLLLPEFATPPPNGAVFPLTLQRVMLTLPPNALLTPPPEVEVELFVTAQLTKLRVPDALFPTAPAEPEPLVRVSPETVTTPGFAAVIRNTALLLLPETVS